MKLSFAKYHALKNDFIVIEKGKSTPEDKLSEIALMICDRRSGVGADGIVFLGKSATQDASFTIVNSDGSFAEKSGNGLRIAGVHIFRKSKKKQCSFEVGKEVCPVTIKEKTESGWLAETELGFVSFETKNVPVKCKQSFMINSPLKIDQVELPVTCLSVGNPHTVLIVENFDFDWQTLGEDIENHPSFPERTNVEFVKPVNRKRLKVCDWERGAGATGSSGTGAAAAVAAMVNLGLADRNCEVQFDNGSLYIYYREDGMIELTGEVCFVAEGTVEV